MRFSIIIPVYNSEQYLDRAVQSVRDQSLADWELILVDDGSPDHSGELCEKWKAADPRIRVLHKPNGGVSSARNAGLALARGDYIFFVDADDYIGTGMLEEADQVLTDTGADVVLVNIRRFFTDHTFRPPLVELHPAMGSRQLLLYLLCGLFREAVSKIVRRTRLTHDRFDETMKSAEDLAFMPDIIREGCTVACTTQNFYYYNKMNAASATSSIAALEGRLNDYRAWRHFLDSCRRYHWEQIDPRLPDYYRAQCMRYAAGALQAGAAVDTERELSTFVENHRPAWMEKIPGEKRLTYLSYYYIYESMRLGWLLCQGLSGEIEGRIIRAFIRFYSVDRACPCLSHEEIRKRDAFMADLEKKTDFTGVSPGQKLAFTMAVHGGGFLLKRKGQKLLRQAK